MSNLRREIFASGPQVKFAREIRGWTQSELAERLGTRQGKISSMESAAILKPALILSLDRIFEGAGWREGRYAPVAEKLQTVEEASPLEHRLNLLEKKVASLERLSEEIKALKQMLSRRKM